MNFVKLKNEIIEIFLAKSKLISQNLEFLENNWDEVLQLMNPEEKEAFKNQIMNFKIKSILDLTIYMYFLFSGCIYLIIIYKNNIVFEIGKKLNLLENPLLKQNHFRWKEIEINVIFPEKSTKIIEELFRKEFFPFIRKTILNHLHYIETNYFDFVGNTIQFIQKRIRPYLQKNIPVTITHFKFENLSNYLENSGNYAIFDFIMEIDKYLRSKLKKRDLLIIFSYDSYLVLSINAKKEVIFERFNNLYIEIKNIVLDYHFFIETLYSENDSLYEIFYKLDI